MPNYKGIQYENTKEDFIKWNRDFPNPLDKGKYHRYYKKGDYYLCLCYVEFMGGKFVGKTLRKYNHDTKDFDFVSDEAEEQGLLSAWENRIRRYESTFLGGGS